MTPARCRRVRAGNGPERGDTPCQLAGQQIRHTASVREAHSVNAARVNAPSRLQVLQQVADVEYIIRSRIPRRAGVPSRMMVGSYRALGIGSDDVVCIGKGREAGKVLLLRG